MRISRSMVENEGVLRGAPLELSIRANAYSIHQHLRSLIISGKIPPDSILSQAALAREIGVSRTPVREAMRMLQNERLIEAQPNNRARVNGFNADELDAIYAMRIFLEPLGIALSIPRMTNAHLDKLEQSLESMSREECRDFDRWIAEHRTFHCNLVAFCGDNLLHYITRLLEQSTRFQYMFIKTHEPVWRAKRGGDHANLVTACRQRQPDRAYLLMLEHLSETALALLDEFPGAGGRPPGRAISAAIGMVSAGARSINEAGILAGATGFAALAQNVPAAE
jgi:DNA-binding GntR family transcriptional regulator